MVDVRFREVVIDCADPPTLAKWWSDFTGYAPRTTRDDWSTIESPDKAMIIGFQKVPEGKVVKNRVHLDVRVGTGLVGQERLAALEAECARLLALGASRGELLLADGVNESCQVMQDVEGNEFCLD